MLPNGYDTPEAIKLKRAAFAEWLKSNRPATPASGNIPMQGETVIPTSVPTQPTSMPAYSNTEALLWLQQNPNHPNAKKVAEIIQKNIKVMNGK